MIDFRVTMKVDNAKKASFMVVQASDKNSAALQAQMKLPSKSVKVLKVEKA